MPTTFNTFWASVFCWCTCFSLLAGTHPASRLPLEKACVVVRPGPRPVAEETATRVLVEEVQKRTGLRWSVSTRWPKSGPVIVLSAAGVVSGWPSSWPKNEPRAAEASKPEGFRLAVTGADSAQPVVWILGADSRGTLFGVGQLMRSLDWGRGSASLPADLDIATAPAFPIRGHQLGYRHTANSYDGWDDRQFEQYIRELALFGANSVEGIPFHDTRKSPHMPISREVMNRRLSEICVRYDMDYWTWSPAEMDLRDPAKRAEHRSQHEALFRDCPRLDAVFFPGGDPGNNAPEIVLDYLAELSRPLRQYHPKAKIWLSMQGFKAEQVEEVYQWIQRHSPDWLGGLVGGPSSPPLPETRARLPRQYGLRDYPDITHTVRCQFPVAWWDPAFHLTLGREPANPRPVFYKSVMDHFSQYTTGSISYSDGVHDDVNKVVWTRLGWNPSATPREIVLEYTRCFFGSTAAESAADGILALEKNWEGPLVENGSVEGSLVHWQGLEKKHPERKGDWRWQLCLLRAYYDAYVRQRLIHESNLERQVNDLLAQAPNRGADTVMAEALIQLQQPIDNPVAQQCRTRVEQLCADLFRSIRLQTSVPRYQASGAERGAVLDYIDRPLNNRWWLEDQFQHIRGLSTPAEKLQELERIRNWENPGMGSFYDEVGNIGKSPHVIRGEGVNTDPMMEKNPNPGFWWRDEGRCRQRLSWQVSMDWPLGLKYHQLDPRSEYCVRLTGWGRPRLRANGLPLKPSKEGRIQEGEFMEYSVPASCVQEGRLLLTFDPLPEEADINWRQQSRVSEVWLLKGTTH